MKRPCVENNKTITGQTLEPCDACCLCQDAIEAAVETNEYGQVEVSPDARVVFADEAQSYTVWMEAGVLHVQTNPGRAVVLPVVSNEIIVGITD